MNVVRRESLSEQAAAVLLERIDAGEWAPGQKLPGETTLAPQLGVGRSTMREAIRQLAGRGILSTRQGAGVFVNAPPPGDDWQGVLRRANIVSVLEARLAIESEAAGLAAERRTPADLRVIRSALATRDANRGELDSHVDTDTAFHRAIVASAHNPILVELFDAFALRSREAMVEMLELSPHPGSSDDQLVHAAIVTAISDGDAVAAVELSRAHLLALRDAHAIDEGVSIQP